MPDYFQVGDPEPGPPDAPVDAADPIPGPGSGVADGGCSVSVFSENELRSLLLLLLVGLALRSRARPEISKS